MLNASIRLDITALQYTSLGRILKNLFLLFTMYKLQGYNNIINKKIKKTEVP